MHTSNHALRANEREFVTTLPKHIAGFTIIAIVKFQSGGKGYYASAIVVTRRWNGLHDFSTHIATLRDDNHIGIDKWSLSSGHYDFNSMTDALRDACARAGLSISD